MNEKFLLYPAGDDIDEDEGMTREEILYMLAEELGFEVARGEVVVSTTYDGCCVAVTRQDEEGRILEVIWEAKP